MIPIPGSQLMNLHRLAPEVVLCLFGMIVMAVDPFVGAARKRTLGWLALVGAVLALACLSAARTHARVLQGRPARRIMMGRR